MIKRRLPAEWERHSATQLHWPSNTETWPEERLERVEKVYLDLLNALSQFEEIHLFVHPEAIQRFEKQLLINNSKLIIHGYPINDVWARDCGPIFIEEEGQFKITNWEYNAWGGKYPPWDADNRIPEYVANYLGMPMLSTGMVLEGGAIETNGKGTLISTESVMLNPNRNPRLTKADIESKLREYFGIERFIWLKAGLAGDDTDGHVDDLTRFLNEDTVVTMLSNDPDDPNYEVLHTNFQILEESGLNIETLPMPECRIEGTTVDGSEYVPASYANYYVANECVLLPLYDERYDHQAMDLLKSYFPDREVIGIPCADLVWGQGSIHCITQQWFGKED
jgi:agmatine deiminase